MSLFQTAIDTLYNDPNIGRMGIDDPSIITLTYPDGSTCRAVPLARPVSEFDQFGNLQTQELTKVLTVRVSEVPVQPPRNTIVTGYAQRWYVQTAERSDTETSWRLNLFVEQ